MKEKVILGVAFEKNWRKIRANVTLQKIIRENRDNFELIRRNAEGKSPPRRMRSNGCFHDLFDC